MCQLYLSGSGRSPNFEQGESKKNEAVSNIRILEVFSKTPTNKHLKRHTGSINWNSLIFGALYD
jgi:hypothetical protein